MPESQSLPEMLTVADVAGQLNVCEQTVRNLASRGKLPAYKIGSQWRIPRPEFLAWLKARKPRKWRQFTSVPVARITITTSSEAARRTADRLERRLGLREASLIEDRLERRLGLRPKG